MKSQIRKIVNLFGISILVATQSSCARNQHTEFINFPDHNGEREIVIMTASYNNKDWYRWSLDSIFAQQYQNYRVIYVDDFSTDGTADLVESYVKEKGQEHRFTLIRNTEHKGAVANHYHAIHTCDDRAIIAIVDGDDGISSPYVLQFLNQIYADNNVWLTYGQFIEYPTGIRGFCQDMPHYVVANNSFRDFIDIPSHMRTFYAGLYKQIKKEDLMLNGEFLVMLADIAAMFPMIEMARYHFKFIPEILYIYNAANVINDHKVSKTLQRGLDLMVRARPRYAQVESPLTPVQS
ncbi:MAG: glycosyltransferase [Candidatus Babeliales bacterium]|nr:glycosyltransferase [Candidatus Babeliales bacterium]